ncbi:GNAT family N-acetyltransferase [Lewinellaceae bacterium SD302]|nr:GNAT family N-acetyltransferase [Lewinellaceae bacterium SD302]
MQSPNDLKITLARKQIDLKRILKLQAKNLPDALSDTEIAEQGFVSASHSLATLSAMNETAASVIVKDGTTLAGYALAMTRKYSKSVPLLAPIFDFQDRLMYQGKTLDEHGYIVMGQVCVAEEYRGLRLADRMYRYFKGCYSIHYPLLVTAISTKNTRSLRVHERCGFTELGQFKAPNGHEWVVVVWDWRD